MNTHGHGKNTCQSQIKVVNYAELSLYAMVLIFTCAVLCERFHCLSANQPQIRTYVDTTQRYYVVSVICVDFHMFLMQKTAKAMRTHQTSRLQRQVSPRNAFQPLYFANFLISYNHTNDNNHSERSEQLGYGTGSIPRAFAEAKAVATQPSFAQVFRCLQHIPYEDIQHHATAPGRWQRLTSSQRSNAGT